MSMLSALDAGIQTVRGGIASGWGQTCDVYRISSTTNGSVVSGTPVIPNFTVRFERVTERVVIEGEIFSLVFFRATCDNRQLKKQDVLVQKGYGNDGSVYTFVQARPTEDTIFARTELTCFISRPHPAAGNPEQQPANTWVSLDTQGAIPKSSEQILVLQNGLYQFVSTGSPANIYVGITQLNRVRDGRELGTPTDLPDEHFLFYVPSLPGEQIERKDRLNLGNSDRYEVLSVHQSDTVGITGSIVIALMLGT